MRKKKKNKGYQAAVQGARSTVKILIYICLILVLVLFGKTAYTFGYSIFNEKGMDAQGMGRDVTIEIPSGADIKEIAKILEKNSVIEDSKVFVIQANLSKYKDSLQPGNYIINSSKTADEILAIIAKEDTEGQPTQEDSKKATEDSSVYDKVDATTVDEESSQEEQGDTTQESEQGE